MTKKISVGVTTYNRWQTCLLSLNSLVKQENRESIEIILVDDCSSENPPITIQSFIADNDVLLIRHKVNLGLAAARNTALAHSTGEFFTFCDDDDQWPVDHAKQLLRVVDHHELEIDAAMAFSPIHKPYFESILGENPDLKSIMTAGITPPVSSQIYRTTMLKQVGGYDERVKSGVDHDLWISLAALNPRVAILYSGGAIVGGDPAKLRMTTREKHRRKKIAEALEIWQPKIVDAFGVEFYHYFCCSYRQYLDYGFFLKSVQRKEYISAFCRLSNPYVWNPLVQAIKRKITGQSPRGLFPKFIRHN